MLPELSLSPGPAAVQSTKHLRLRFCLWALAAAPVLMAAVLIVRYGVDLGRMDALIIGGMLLNIQESGVALGEFLLQANNSRLIFPRLISVGIGLLTHWDTRYEMWLTLALMLANFAMMIALYRRASRQSVTSPFLLPLLAAGASTIIFSPFQTELVWGFQYLTHLPMTCLLASLLIGGSKLRTSLRHILPVLLCIVATFSYANGMITWLLVPAFLAGSGLFRGRRLAWLVLWMAIAAACLWLYFHGYHKPVRQPSLFAFRDQQLLTILAFFSFLGAPLSFGAAGTPITLLVAAAVGLISVCATLLFLGRLARSGQFGLALPWGILFAYAVGSGAIATLGRIGSSQYALLGTRYAGFNTYAIAAVFFIAALAWQFAPWRGSWRFGMRVACALLVLAFIGLWSRSLGDNIHEIRKMGRGVERARAALPYYEQVASLSGSLDYFFPDLAKGALHARRFRAAGLIRPAPITQEIYSAALSRRSAGFVEQLAADGAHASAGWASIPGQKRPADAVVITRKSADGQRKPIGVCLPVNQRPDVAKIVGKNNGRDYGWTLVLPAASLDLLEAWAVDGSTDTLYPLTFAPQVQR